jgi:hypothetical protein
MLLSTFTIHDVLHISLHNDSRHDNLTIIFKVPLCLTKHHAMKMFWGRGVIAPHILHPALNGGKWSASRPGRFTPKERDPDTLWIGGWVGSRAVVKRKIPLFLLL